MSNLAPAILSVLTILGAGASPAAVPPTDPTTVEGLVVTAPAKTDEAQIAGFVSGVSATSADKRLARWDRKVCPGVLGLKPAYAQMMVDHIAATAQAVGLDVGAPGCKANILILATADSDTMVRKAVKENPTAFARYTNGISRGTKALDAFVVSKAPVRWWHVTSTVTADGQKYRQGESVLIRGGGRTKSITRSDFDHVIIVMDVSRTKVVNFGALADYMAMVSLAQINPDADTQGVSTILNLFTDREAGATAPEALTDWDLAYLRGLYGARRDAVRASRQEADVTRTMAGTLIPKPGEDKDKPKSETKPAPTPEPKSDPREDKPSRSEPD